MIFYIFQKKKDNVNFKEKALEKSYFGRDLKYIICMLCL